MNTPDGIHVIKMPDLGEGITEVELVAWRVSPGERVAEDQILADVMTDKATVEIPSPVVGTVLSLGGAVGQVLAVGAELIRIELTGAEGASEAPATASKVAPAMPPETAPTSPLDAAVAASPDKTNPVRPAPVEGPTGADKPIASPAVRRRAWELGIDLAQVAASGAGGRILQADLDAHVVAPGAGTPAATGTMAGAGVTPRHDEERIPVVGLRRRIAQRMQDAKRRIPHFTYVEEVDVTELEALRAQLNAQWAAQRGHLTLLPLLLRAVVLAVREFPQINARFDDEVGVLTRHGAVHIGIATQTGAGLMVPVLRHAEAHDLWSSATELARLAAIARTGKATRDELTGSTITISSLGPLGGIVSTPVINSPEVAIVGVNRMVLRPVMRDGAVLARQMMNLSSSFDHRVVDGVDAAGFVQAVRRTLESPALLFVS
ncbi:MAG: 2-oxo acid dehydrogenase subunit E2 [Rhodoferax sp.]|uniref:dihydrolipoamide acetyltransferase family protein n=1 Tax=Rhodoferax sp. TaxID=50421 RepID=UPI001822F489|nr:dihydrolipoamide acetyltransferase family protein [Rhodoferax sp.]NMM13857.1 2-oxo acid dehydrogenase subunit E2 [Rhodoferax sp.]NMM20343.1 2-oxo acid dehydrogenase subunit E2 [Rhodoferax sp.]